MLPVAMEASPALELASLAPGVLAIRLAHEPSASACPLTSTVPPKAFRLAAPVPVPPSKRTRPLVKTKISPPVHNDPLSSASVVPSSTR